MVVNILKIWGWIRSLAWHESWKLLREWKIKTFWYVAKQRKENSRIRRMWFLRKENGQFLSLAPCHAEHSCLQRCLPVDWAQFPHTRNSSCQKIRTAKKKFARRLTPKELNSASVLRQRSNSRAVNLHLGPDNIYSLKNTGRALPHMSSHTSRDEGAEYKQKMQKAEAWNLSFSAEDCSSAGKCSRTLQSMQCLAGQNNCIHSPSLAAALDSAWKSKGKLVSSQRMLLPKKVLQLLTYLGSGKVPSAKQVLRTAWFGRCMVYWHTSGRRLTCTVFICGWLLRSLALLASPGSTANLLLRDFLDISNINTIKINKTSGKLYVDISWYQCLSMLHWCLNHMVDEPPSPHGRQTSRKATEENQQHILQRWSLMLQALQSAMEFVDQWDDFEWRYTDILVSFACTLNCNNFILAELQKLRSFFSAVTQGTVSVHFSKHRPFEAPGSQEVAQGMTKHPYHRSPTSPQSEHVSLFCE